MKKIVAKKTKSKIIKKVECVIKKLPAHIVYYGNASAPDASNGPKPFDIFDDLTTVLGTKWSKVTSGGSVTQSGTTVNLLNINEGTVNLSNTSAFTTLETLHKSAECAIAFAIANFFLINSALCQTLKIQFSKKMCITIIVLLFFAGISSDSFGQTWYNSSWAHRKSHVVNAASGAGTNYQVKITVRYGNGTDAAGNVYCSNLSKPDFTDIRFAAADGTTLLSHWIQSYTASNNAVFWVKIPADLSATNQTVYMYFGDAAATSISSGTGTFIYYDDGSTTTGWTIAGTVGSSNVQGNPANSLRANGAIGSYLYRNTGIGPNTFTFFNVRTDAGNIGNFFFQCSSTGLGRCIVLIHEEPSTIQVLLPPPIGLHGRLLLMLKLRQLTHGTSLALL